jgi:hypothetical protein
VSWLKSDLLYDIASFFIAVAAIVTVVSIVQLSRKWPPQSRPPRGGVTPEVGFRSPDRNRAPAPFQSAPGTPEGLPRPRSQFSALNLRSTLSNSA